MMGVGMPERLSQPLDASRIKQREGRGRGPKLSYLETHDVIRTANEIFGFGGWGHEIVDLRLIPGVAVQSKEGKDGIHVGYVCIVRLTVKGCETTSGVGYGDAVEYNQSAPVTAHELAAKEAESDALKRALKNYGDQFGLALYDKQAASSGHVVREDPKPKAEPKPRPEPAAAAGPMAQQLSEFTKLAKAYHAIAPAGSYDLQQNLEWAKSAPSKQIREATGWLSDQIDEALKGTELAA